MHGSDATLCIALAEIIAARLAPAVVATAAVRPVLVADTAAAHLAPADTAAVRFAPRVVAATAEAARIPARPTGDDTAARANAAALPAATALAPRGVDACIATLSPLFLEDARGNADAAFCFLVGCLLSFFLSFFLLRMTGVTFVPSGFIHFQKCSAFLFLAFMFGNAEI